MSEIEQEKEVWKSHPLYKNHQGSNFARVKNMKTKRFLKGNIDLEGYTQLHFHGYPQEITKKVALHIFIFECFFNVIDSKVFQVDHLNPDKSKYDYNYLRNLDKKTIAEHVQKTHRGKTPNRRPQTRKAIIRIKIINGKEVERIVFNSMEELIKIGFTKQGVDTCLNGKQKTHRGYKFELQDFESKKNEVWITLEDRKFKSCQVSSLGRIKYNGTISYGCTGRGGYLIKTINKQTYRVHWLVTYAFWGPAPTPQHTVHHKNHIITDNNKDNLEWRDKKEQSIDQKDKKKVSAYDAKTGQHFKTWDTTREAAEELKMSHANISNVCNGKSYTANGYVWKYIQKTQQPEDKIDVSNKLENKGGSIQVQAYFPGTKNLFKQFNSLQDAANEFGIKQTVSLRKACLTEGKKLYNYEWSFVDGYCQQNRNKKVQAFDWETQEFIKEWDNISSAAKELNIKSKDKISQVCNGKRKTCGGYYWKWV